MEISSHPVRKSPITAQVILFSVVLFLLCCIYLQLSTQEFTFRMLNKAFAGSAVILIGLSFVVSSMHYFWNIGGEKIIYRRDIGISGATCAIIHAFLSLFVVFEVIPANNPNPDALHATAFVFGAVALAIFIDMMLISNVAAMKTLGGVLWRKILHIGYVAYFFTILHFTLRGYERWIAWYTLADIPFVPFDLLLVLYGMSILGLRLAMEISLRRGKQLTSSASNS
jgi:DMSO/TMAO reductase YedYZ heme-binding membrane subunit